MGARQSGGRTRIVLKPRGARRVGVVVKIKVAHDWSDGVSGALRILADLRDAGEVVSSKTVAKLMRANEMRGISSARGDRSPRSPMGLCARSRTWSSAGSTAAC